tara:strand:+ start:27 stop:1124 length:1098 start_codon:yes stop_codon:yes gene_type:complete
MAKVGADELRERVSELQAAALAEGLRLDLVGTHTCGGSESTLLYANLEAPDRSQALCLQLDLNPPWGGGEQAILVWSRRRAEVIQAAGWLRELDLVRDQVARPEEPLTPAALYDLALRQVGHAFEGTWQSLLSEALSAPDPELREAAARVIGILQLGAALPDVARALEREQHPPNRAVYADLLGCLVGDAIDVRWLKGDFEASCAQVMAEMPEQVALKVEEPGAFAWGGEPPAKGFELRAHPGLGVALEVFQCPAWLKELLPAGLAEAELSVPARLICDPRYSVERYEAVAAALTGAADPSELIHAAEDALARAQTWPLRLLAEHSSRLDPSQQAHCEGLRALPQWLPGLDLTPPMLLAGLGAVP